MLLKKGAPVPEHTNAVLVETDGEYPAAVAALRYLGDPESSQTAPHRRALQLGQEYVPDLVRMTRDLLLHESNTPDCWAPTHAILALTDLDVSANVADLIPLLDLEHEDIVFHYHVSALVASAGVKAVVPLITYVADPMRWDKGVKHAIDALTVVAIEHCCVRSIIIDVATDILCEARTRSSEVCTAAVIALVSLRATETLPIIRRAFALGRIEEWLTGDWASIQKDFGIRPDLLRDPVVAFSATRLSNFFASIFDVNEEV